MALAFCTTVLILSKFGGLLLNFSPGVAGHTRPADSLRGISLSGSEYVFFKWVSSSSFGADREPDLGCWKSCANWYGSLKKRSLFFFLWLRLFLAVSALLSAECLALKRRHSSCSPLFSSSVAVFLLRAESFHFTLSSTFLRFRSDLMLFNPESIQTCLVDDILVRRSRVRLPLWPPAPRPTGWIGVSIM